MKVLIADDSPTARLLMKAWLKKWGHQAQVVEDGVQAWKALTEQDGPRIAILDWMMPGLSGPELCRKLKHRRNAPFIYTIIVTAKTKSEDVVTALDAGAGDFISKPFDPNEFRSRLSVGVRMLENKIELEEKNHQLERYSLQMQTLAEQRARQLLHTERMATLGTMSAGIAHEINNPTSFISGNVQTFQKLWEQLEPLVRDKCESGNGESERYKFILVETPRILAEIRSGVSRISKIVQRLRCYARQDHGERTPCDLTESIETALQLCHNTLKRNVTVERSLAESLPETRVCAQQIEQVLVNLFINSAQAMEKRKKGVLHVNSSADEDFVRIVVEDSGPGIPEEVLAKIWDPFFTTKEAGKGTGLGLSICQSLIEENQGSIRAENRPGGGARFVVEIPR